MPDFLNPTQAELAARADELAARLTGLPADPSAGDDDLRAAVMAASKSAGVWPLTQQTDPPAAAADLVVVRDALGRHNVGHLPGVFGPAPGLLADAPEPLRSRVLPAYLAGELRGGFGFTEPADAPRPTWARRDGDELVVNGQKSYVTGGADADFVNTLVDVDRSGPALVLIETDRPGVELTRRFGTLDGNHHAAFTFTDVRVPAGNLLGAPGRGLSRALSQIGAVRLAIAADCVGLCRFVVEFVERHLREGGSEDDAAVRVALGAMRVGAYAARSVVYRTARLVDAGENTVNETMAAKVLATETAAALVDDAIQIVGGQALADDHPLSSILRRVRAARLAEGPTDVLHAGIARGSLDLGLGRL
ncbi:MAG TPA: hypothetical protein DEP66_03225 [Acidimicrobiaceae bacterium]|nr:hypothetical protein [Acidimicrobiaceae bacterium]